MALDDEQLTWREMAERDREHYLEVLHQEWLDREACESVEAMELHWNGVMRQRPDSITNIRYKDERQGIDSRMFGP